MFMLLPITTTAARNFCPVSPSVTPISCYEGAIVTGMPATPIPVSLCDCNCSATMPYEYYRDWYSRVVKVRNSSVCTESLCTNLYNHAWNVSTTTTSTSTDYMSACPPGLMTATYYTTFQAWHAAGFAQHSPRPDLDGPLPNTICRTKKFTYDGPRAAQFLKSMTGTQWKGLSVTSFSYWSGQSLLTNTNMLTAAFYCNSSAAYYMNQFSVHPDPGESMSYCNTMLCNSPLAASAATNPRSEFTMVASTVAMAIATIII